MNKYKHKIPRDDLKRFAKEIAKKLVASDFKAGRVKDPTKCDEKQQRKVKDYCKQFFDKAAHKHKKSEEERAARHKAKKDKQHSSSHSKEPSSAAQSPVAALKAEYADEDEDIKMSDHELDFDDESKPTPPSAATPSEANGQNLKRKREDMSSPAEHIKQEEREIPQSPLKKPHMDSPEDNDKVTPPPPPPPPPETPIEGTPNGRHHHTEGHLPPTEDDVEEAVGEEQGDTAMEIDNDASDVVLPTVENGDGKHSHHDAQGHGQESKFKDVSMQDVKMLAQMEGGDEDEVEW